MGCANNKRTNITNDYRKDVIYKCAFALVSMQTSNCVVLDRFADVNSTRMFLLLNMSPKCFYDAVLMDGNIKQSIDVRFYV